MCFFLYRFFWVDPGQPIWPVTQRVDRINDRIGFKNYNPNAIKITQRQITSENTLDGRSSFTCSAKAIRKKHSGLEWSPSRILTICMVTLSLFNSIVRFCILMMEEKKKKENEFLLFKKKKTSKLLEMFAWYIY